MRTYLQYLTSNKVLVSFFLIVSIIIASFAALALVNAQTSPAQPYTLVWSDEFDTTRVDTNKWSVVHQTGSTESHHQGRYLARNTSVSNGNLHILTERHCTTNGELPSDSNRSSAPCPTGTKTVYSSGQVKTDYNWTSGKIEIRAKMPKTTQSGLWSGYWLRQQGKWCTNQYGEIDILEWYSDPRSTNASTATTHISCANEKLKSRQHVEHVNGSLADSWHTWGVEWDTTGVTYYLDGNVVKSIASHRPNDNDQNKDTYQDYDGVSQAMFEQIVGQPWQLRINTQVYPADDQWHEAPDNAATFTPQTMLVDYVRVYKKGNNTTTPPPAATPTPAQPTPTTPVTPVETTAPEKEKKDTPAAPVVATPAPAVPDTPVKNDVAPRQGIQTPVVDEPAHNEPVAATQEEVAPSVSSEIPTSLPQTGGAFWPALGSAPFALFASAFALRYHWRSRVSN